MRTEGVIKSRYQIGLVAEASGRVLAVSPGLTEGGIVDGEQVLVQLDSRVYRYGLIEAEARVANAKRDLAVEKGSVRQAKSGWRDLGSEEANALSLRKPYLEAAEKALSAAKAARDRAQLSVDRTQLKAPFARSRVQSTSVNVGQYVSAGTVVATLYDDTLFEVRLPLTKEQLLATGISLQEALSSRLWQQQPYTVRLFTSLGDQSYEWQGRVVRMATEVEEQSPKWPGSLMGSIGRSQLNAGAADHSFYWVVEVDQSFDDQQHQQLVPAGLLVEVEIPGKQYERVIQVPKHALWKGHLLVVNDQHQLEKRTVTVVNEKGDTVVWLQVDLQEGVSIVTSDASNLQLGIDVSAAQVGL